MSFRISPIFIGRTASGGGGSAQDPVWRLIGGSWVDVNFEGWRLVNGTWVEGQAAAGGGQSGTFESTTTSSIAFVGELAGHGL